MSETIGKAYVQIEPSFEGVVPKIDKEFGGAGKESGSSFMSGFGSVLGTVGKVAAGAAAAGTAAVAGMVKSATSAFANYEQLVGGVETLFADSADIVMANADRAFTTAGLSANDYMETVTSFSASLLQSLGGDTVKAAETADQAITDMSDNANKMGSSMESIQNAYQGFAKQNYTMLDNLKLGYGGTKEEMKRLLDDAGKLAGVKFDLSSYSDIINAIHVIQENMGITGTTAKEAATTISGSLAMTKSSWENVMTAIGTGDDNAINKAIDDLTNSAKTLGTNVMPVIKKSLEGVSKLISELAPEFVSMIPELVASVVPDLLNAGVEIISALGDGIMNAIPVLLPTITDVIVQLVQTLMSSAPEFIQCGIEMLAELADGISEALPTLIPMAVDAIVEIANALTDPGNITMLVDAALQIITGLAQGMIDALPSLIERIPEIITNIVTALMSALPQLIQGAITLVTMLAQHAPEIIQAFVDAIPVMITGIVTALTDPQNVTAIIAGLVQLFIAVATAMPQISQALYDAIPQVIDGIIEAFVALGPQLQQSFTEIMAGLAPTFQQISQFAQTAYNAIQTVFTPIGNWFKTKFNEAVAGIKAAFNSITSYFKSVYQQILNVFANIGAQFKNVGTQIVNGIKNGIGGSWDSLKKFLKSLCDDLVALAKRILGIESPSKRFRDEVGQWIPAGIAAGMENGLDTLKHEAARMSEEALTAASVSAQMVSSISSPYIPDFETAPQNQTMALLNEYLPLIARAVGQPIEVRQDSKGMFEAVRKQNNILVTATGYHALA